MTHYAAIWIFGHYYTTHKPDTITTVWVVVLGVLLLVGFAYLVMKVYDTPVRRYLSTKRQQAAQRQEQVASDHVASVRSEEVLP